MKNKKIAEALSEVDDRYVAEAARKRKRRPIWLAAVAAAVTVVILALTVLNPLAVGANAVSVAQYPDYEWKYRPHMTGTAERLSGFFHASMQQTLSNSDGENQAYSPINLYLGLSSLSELTAGSTRQQILTLLDAEDAVSVRDEANEVWAACYHDDGDQTLLANSLWLDQGLDYHQPALDALAQNYYTSVYQADLGSSAANRAIGSWLNRQTGGILKQETSQISLDPGIVLALYSTVYFQAKWTDSVEFSSANNTDDVFHAPSGDITCTYMNKKELQMYYYWGESFGAVALSMKDGSRMWLILPDEGKTVDDVLAGGEYAQMLFQVGDASSEDPENSKYMKVNLSLPKFDIRANHDLKEDLQALGITDVFSKTAADFSASIRSDLPVWLTGVNQATRVAIDEKGVTAASYIEFPGAGAAAPPEEIIDFILDRPFLFVITNRYYLPLFAGVVNEP